jgi:leucyl aminopeptidase (aminopeptidase T)
MEKDFYIKRKRYADLLVRFGLNVMPGQVVNISAESCNRDFAIEVSEAAYKVGAKFVNLDLLDQRLLKTRILHSNENDLSYVPTFLSIKYKNLVDDASANLKIIGSEDPEILSDLDPKRLNAVRLNQHIAIKYFYDEGIGKSKVHWTVAAAATEDDAVDDAISPFILAIFCSKASNAPSINSACSCPPSATRFITSAAPASRINAASAPTSTCILDDEDDDDDTGTVSTIGDPSAETAT